MQTIDTMETIDNEIVENVNTEVKPKTLEELIAMPDMTKVRHKIDGGTLGEIVIRPMTSDEREEYVRAATPKYEGAKLNESKLQCMIIANNIVEPNLKSADFLEQMSKAHGKHYRRAEDCVNAILSAGEVVYVAGAILSKSGFKEFKTMVDDAKK